jgi:hypothetical protein
VDGWFLGLLFVGGRNGGKKGGASTASFFTHYEIYRREKKRYERIQTDGEKENRRADYQS